MKKNLVFILIVIILLVSSSNELLADDNLPVEERDTFVGPDDIERKQRMTEWMFGIEDVPFDHWFRPTLSSLYEIMDGVSETKFDPEGSMTRGMMVKTLHNYRCNWELRGEKEIASKPAPFTDVKRDAWYAEAVDWAYERGIIKGVDDATFAPNAPITKEEVAVIIKAYSDYMKEDYYYDKEKKDLFSAFKDCDRVSPWAKEAMIWAVNNRIIMGNPAKMIEPQKTATRAEVGTMICNYMVPGHLPPGQ